MHNLFDEGLISLADAGRLIPSQRSGESVVPSTVFRWVTKGTTAPDGRLVKLQSVRIGGRWFTSKAAVMRYAEALSSPPPGRGLVK